MNIFSLWSTLCAKMVYVGLPLVMLYHTVCGSVFLNVAAEDAVGLEKIANDCLIPVQYLLAGKKAIPVVGKDGETVVYRLEQRFDYRSRRLWYKTVMAYCALPSSLIIGSALKVIAYASPEVRDRKKFISWSLSRSGVSHKSNREYYKSIGIESVSWEETEEITSEGYKRRPQDVHHMQTNKDALREIIKLLDKKNILYWLDCGTCLGAYRYGGIIPWDWDLDIAVLQPDFDNVKQALTFLDSKKYQVQDWSSRDKPKTYLKVYVKETRCLIDIYHFAIDSKKRMIHSICSNIDSVFLPKSWKIRESRYIMDTPFSCVFPLKKTKFDGVEAYVPGSTKKYLQMRYGENLAPAKLYNSFTGEFEKDPTHPYWQLPHAM